ncbi:hypothetical protein [Winogradskya humida]|uniref:MFS transporter n=1 Tax=Winogradskya humida TaxID=113566 RepID=A0ABQ4A071_9ACTN|nr:hypothetical protein [Actinoplanes humidus]GIE24241.1 hypothetical protein Ahu01nite_073430 [Actinoplanes humidus]
MSAKNPTPDSGPEREPVLRVQLTVPRSVCWMLAGALLGNLNDLGPIFQALEQLTR